jgi:hypothetical protein
MQIFSSNCNLEQHGQYTMLRPHSDSRELDGGLCHFKGCLLPKHEQILHLYPEVRVDMVFRYVGNRAQYYTVLQDKNSHFHYRKNLRAIYPMNS